jgi:ABC-type phosphate transport system permease subunit
MNKFGAKETEQIFAEHEQRMAKRKLETKKETRRLFLAYLGVSIAALFVIWILTFLIATGLTTISEVGLKSVVEQVWCGKDATCQLSETKE